jgi:hypothetical protein
VAVGAGAAAATAEEQPPRHASATMMWAMGACCRKATTMKIKGLGPLARRRHLFYHLFFSSPSHQRGGSSSMARYGSRHTCSPAEPPLLAVLFHLPAALH